MRLENISSVNLVKSVTPFEVENRAPRNKYKEDQRPVQAYNGKKGTPSLVERPYSTDVKANTGPVEPMIVNGCADASA